MSPLSFFNLNRKIEFFSNPTLLPYYFEKKLNVKNFQRTAIFTPQLSGLKLTNFMR